MAAAVPGSASSVPRPGRERQLVASEEPEPPARYLARKMKHFPGAAWGKKKKNPFWNCCTHRDTVAPGSTSPGFARLQEQQLPAGLPSVIRAEMSPGSLSCSGNCTEHSTEQDIPSPCCRQPWCTALSWDSTCGMSPGHAGALPGHRLSLTASSPQTPCCPQFNPHPMPWEPAGRSPSPLTPLSLCSRGAGFE